MILGISGKKRSGKDLTADIIRFITYQSQRDKDYSVKALEEYLKFEHVLERYAWENMWEVKKFADKLKDILCLLIGCTREQLESDEFKKHQARRRMESVEV